MKIYIGKDYAEMSKIAADIIAAQIILNPESVLGLATGSTPIGTYKELIKQNRNKKFTLKNVKTINLDEYKGIKKSDPQSYYYFMQENFFKYTDIKFKNTNIPNGRNFDSKKECKRYDELINELGNVDIQILGIGTNGHIGFNEPSNSFSKNTHIVELDESTREANSRFFKSIDEVPKEAYTMGIKSIMGSKKVLLLASGTGKCEIIKKALFGEITPQVPASILQLHKDLIVILDAEAASKIKNIKKW